MSLCKLVWVDMNNHQYLRYIAIFVALLVYQDLPILPRSDCYLTCDLRFPTDETSF